MTKIAAYLDLLVVLRARRLALGLSLEQVDELVGWADRYAAKVEAWTPGKGANGRRRAVRRLSVDGFFDMAKALGLSIEVVADADACSAASMTELDKRRREILEPHFANWNARRLRATPAAMKAKGARALADKLGEDGRRARAMRAAKARWDRARKVKEVAGARSGR